jgi:hypothetical protein
MYFQRYLLQACHSVTVYGHQVSSLAELNRILNSAMIDEGLQHAKITNWLSLAIILDLSLAQKHRVKSARCFALKLIPAVFN